MSNPTRPAMPPAALLPLPRLAHVIRSKNAGPTQLTIDIFFNDAHAFELAAGSGAMSEAAVAARYALPEGQVRRYLLPDIAAIKYSMPRRQCAGTPGDGDVYGAQQHGPMLEILL